MEFIDLIKSTLIFRTIILFVFGLCIGSFLNVVIYRLPIMLNNIWKKECQEFLDENIVIEAEKFNLSYPSSHCPSCKAKVPFWSNIPIVGFLILCGKCYKCKAKISVRYLFIELLTGIVFACVGYVHNDLLLIGFSLVFFSILIALIFIDFDTYLLPDELTLPLVWIGLLTNLNGAISGSLKLAVFGAVVGYMSLWSIYWIFKLITGKEGMGYGDFKLLAAIGAFLGVTYLCNVLIVASLLGIVYTVYLRVCGKSQRGDAIPFGPFLGAGAIMTFFCGNYFINVFLLV
ncbi:MAG: A24 family peptidase [Burkholderiales bacterium]|nr:A24 family peptidase [Burkholderiales bacterium]